MWALAVAMFILVGCEADVVLAVRDGAVTPPTDTGVDGGAVDADGSLPPGWEEWDCTTCVIGTCAPDEEGQCDYESDECVWECERER